VVRQLLEEVVVVLVQHHQGQVLLLCTQAEVQVLPVVVEHRQHIPVEVVEVLVMETVRAPLELLARVAAEVLLAIRPARAIQVAVVVLEL
jgi:hypothetical protein